MIHVRRAHRQYQALVVITLILCSDLAQALPDDWIFVQGFEPGTQVAFVGTSSALFTSASQHQSLEVRVTDSMDQTVLNPQISWYLEAGPEYQINGDTGTRIDVTAASFSVSSGLLYAIHTGSGASAIAVVAMGQLQPDAVHLDSSVVISGATPPDTGHADIVLQRDKFTELLQAGDVLISDEQVGLLVRVLDDPIVEPTEIMVRVRQAQITEAFSDLSISARSEATSLRFAVGDVVESGSRTLSDDLDCEVGTENAVGFDITGPDVDMNFSIYPEAKLELVGGNVTEFSIAGIASASLNASTGSLSYTSNITGTVVCTFQLPEIFTPAVPLWAFSFQLNTAPTVGFEFEANFSGPSFTITGPEGEVSGRASAGIRYTPAQGWAPLAETGWSGSFEPLSTQFSNNITFSLKGGPFVTNEFGLIANLGRPPLGLQLADLRFIRLKGIGELEFSLSSPLSTDRIDYAGPQWDIDAILSAQYKAALADGLLFSLLEALEVPTEIEALSGDLFTPIQHRIAQSPLPTINVSCSRGCPANPAENDMVTMTTTASGVDSGQVSFAAAKDGSQLTSSLSTEPMTSGAATYDWSPTELQEGSYVIAPRLVSDTLSQLFPYANPTGASVQVSTQERKPSTLCFIGEAMAQDGDEEDFQFGASYMEGAGSGVSVTAEVGSIRASASSFPARLSADVASPDQSSENQSSLAWSFRQVGRIYDFNQSSATFGLSGQFSGLGSDNSNEQACLRIRIALFGQAHQSASGQVCRCEHSQCENGYLGHEALKDYTGGDFAITIPNPGGIPFVSADISLELTAGDGFGGNFELSIPTILQLDNNSGLLSPCSL